jgi:hypothetical protein
MRAAKARFLSYLGRSNTTFASFAVVVGIFSITALVVSLLPVQKAAAREQCHFSEQIGGTDFTEGDQVKSKVLGDQLCIGPGFGPTSSSGISVFEFIIKFNGPVKNPKIHFEDAEGKTGELNSLSGNFQRVNDTTYVIKPEHKAGYVYLANYQSDLRGCPGNPASTIKISVEANGKKQNFTHKLCEAIEFNRDYSKQFIADQIPADGESSAGNGRISGQFTTIRFGAPEGIPERNGRSNKRCVTEISLAQQGTDPQHPGDTKTGNQDSDWYSLVDGQLEIPNVPPGKYNLRITYNDRLCMQQDYPNTPAEYTVDNMTVAALGFEVKAGEETKITLVNEAPGTGQGEEAEEPPVCTTGTGLAGALAWVLCPVAALIANATEFIEKNIILPYLTVSPLTTDPSNPAYLLWQAIRNVANIAFIVAFFMVIFSQATSIGISNYGIKRLLPRIAIVAICTNLSYFIVAFAIDAFNIFGAGAGQLVMDALKAAKVGDQNVDPSAGQFWALGGAALVAVLFKAGPVLGWLFGLIGIAFLIILVAVFVLVIRQMLIILLTIISPLAFVAWLLPNTEKYFTKWRGLLIQLLMMYPLIVLLFASGKIFGALLGNPNYTLVGEDKAASGDIAEALRVIFQFIATIAPLGLLLFVFAASGALIGKITNRARSMARQLGQRTGQGIRNSKVGQFAAEKLADRRTRLAGTVPTNMKNPLNWKRGAAHRLRQSGVYRAMDRATGGYGTYRQRENASARRELEDKAQRFLGNDLNAAFALEAAGGNAGALRKIVKQGYYNPRDANGNIDTSKQTQIGNDTRQRLQQFLGAGNYKGSAAAKATARVLSDTNQLKRHSYENLAKMAGAEGDAARDEFIAEQNVYNDKNNLPHLAQAGWGVLKDNNGNTRTDASGKAIYGFKQYAPEMGLKDEAAVFSSLRLGDTKKQVFQDEGIRGQLHQVRNEGRGTARYDNTLREAIRMKPDQLDNFLEGMASNIQDPVAKQNFKDTYRVHMDEMRDEIARGRAPGGGGGPGPAGPPPAGGAGGGGGGRRPPGGGGGGGTPPPAGGGGPGPIPAGGAGGWNRPPGGGTPPPAGGATPPPRPPQPPAGGGGGNTTTGSPSGGYTPPSGGGGTTGGSGFPAFGGAPQGGGRFNPRNNPNNTTPSGGGTTSGSNTTSPSQPTAADYSNRYNATVSAPSAGSNQTNPVVDFSQQAFQRHGRTGESRQEFTNRMMDVQREINNNESRVAQQQRNNNVVSAPPPAPEPAPATPRAPSTPPPNIPSPSQMTPEQMQRAMRGEFDTVNNQSVAPERTVTPAPTPPTTTSAPTPETPTPQPERRRATRPAGPPNPTTPTPPTNTTEGGGNSTSET